MILYAESSAVLAWLLGEKAGTGVRRALRAAADVVASELTLVECDRALIRAAHLGDVPEHEAAARRRTLSRASSGWTFLMLSDDVLERARQPFPAEPVRTLDALHLASALTVRARVPETSLLALDDRVRRNGTALGFVLEP